MRGNHLSNRANNELYSSSYINRRIIKESIFVGYDQPCTITVFNGEESFLINVSFKALISKRAGVIYGHHLVFICSNQKTYIFFD